MTRAGLPPTQKPAAPAEAASPSTTQQDTVYATLRQWITVGRFLPGERLKIRNVAADLGVGQMPVRAALQRLAAEGALINVPHAGVMLPLLSAPELDDLVQMRMLLEGEAAARGSLQLRAAQIKTLHALCQRMARALAAGRAADYLAANEDFHVLLYRAAGSPLLFELIDKLWLKAGPISNQLFDTPEPLARLNDAHVAVMRAIEQRDSAGARQAIAQDIREAARFLRPGL
ncbi:MAG: GntR family transcriptional regulator [Rhodoferax sp.]|nr:GntR family transcriptional regulator [Rhodoferax sp.]